MANQIVAALPEGIRTFYLGALPQVLKFKAFQAYAIGLLSLKGSNIKARNNVPGGDWLSFHVEQ